MPISEDYVSIVDPNDVTVPERQRRELKVDDLVDSIKRHGVLHPIIVTKDFVLIAGGRRLEACRKLGRKVPYRFYEALGPVEQAIVELEENVKRSNISWQERVLATAKIHKLYLSIDPTWKQEKTAEKLGVMQPLISKQLLVSEAMDNPRVAEADSLGQAYNIVATASERKRNSTVAGLYA